MNANLSRWISILCKDFMLKDFLFFTMHFNLDVF